MVYFRKSMWQMKSESLSFLCFMRFYSSYFIFFTFFLPQSNNTRLSVIFLFFVVFWLNLHKSCEKFSRDLCSHELQLHHLRKKLQHRKSGLYWSFYIWLQLSFITKSFTKGSEESTTGEDEEEEEEEDGTSTLADSSKGTRKRSLDARRHIRHGTDVQRYRGERKDAEQMFPF